MLNIIKNVSGKRIDSVENTEVRARKKAALYNRTAYNIMRRKTTG